MPNHISFTNRHTVRSATCWSQWIWLSTASRESDRMEETGSHRKCLNHAHAQSFDRCEPELHSRPQSSRSFWPVAGIESSRSLPQAKRIVSSGDENGALVHSGQTTVHARDLSTSGDFRSLPSGHFLAMQCSIKFIDFNTLQNELCVGLWMRYGWASFYSWMNHYLTLNALPGMNKDFYGTKRKRGDPVWAKLPR